MRGIWLRPMFFAATSLTTRSRIHLRGILLGVIATRLQLWSNAVEFFRLAREFGMADAQAHYQQAASTAAMAPRPAPDERYLLIKSWGAGFWSDVSHVLGGLVLAEITDRKPVVHWGPNSHFTDGTCGNAFTLFFEPVSALTIDDLSRLDHADFFPQKWRNGNLREEENSKWAGAGAQLDAIYFLNRPEKVAIADFYISLANFAPWIPPQHPLASLSIAELYRYAIQKYFRPRNDILNEAKAFFAEKIAGAPYIATHIRGSDKVKECTFTTDSETFLSYVTGETYKILDRANPGFRIFLMTDDERIVRRTVDRYGKRVVLTPSRRTDNDEGIHFRNTVGGRRLGIEVMIDVLVALQATAFIGLGGSNVAAMVALLRDWPPKQCLLIGPSILLRRSPMPYLDRSYRDLETPDMDVG